MAQANGDPQLSSRCLTLIRPIFLPLVPKTFLNPPSAEYFTNSRSKALGMNLDEYAGGAEKAYEDFKPFAKQLGSWYAETEGPFLMGLEVSFADVMVLGLLRMLDRLGVVGRFFEMEGGDRLKAVYEASGKWFERDTY